MRSIPLLLGLCGLSAACSDTYRITVTALQITDDSDSYGSPEIEVYLFAGGSMIGCAGSRHGLQGVDAAGVRYEPNAVLVDDDSDRDIRIGGDAIRFEVWEDDDDPVCPTAPRREGNDVLGVGPSMTVVEWFGLEGEIAFGSVSAFRVEIE